MASEVTHPRDEQTAKPRVCEKRQSLGQSQQPLSTSDFETRVYFMNLYIGTIFEGLTEAFVNVRAALRPSDFLFLHLRFARDRRLFKGNLVSFGQFGCVRRHRHK